MKNQEKSPVQIQEQLKGIDYPATRQDLVDHVKKGKGESSGVVEILKKLPDKKYNSPVEVSQALGDLE